MLTTRYPACFKRSARASVMGRACRSRANRPIHVYPIAGATARGMAILLPVLAMVLLAACGRRAEILTESREGRRVGLYDVDNGYVAYIWYPAQLVSTQGHLVVLDVVTGNETELEPDLNGPMAMCRGRVVWWNSRLRDDKGKSDITVYDLQKGQSLAIAHAKVQGLDADGEHVVWSESYESGGSDVCLYDFGTARQRTISSGGLEGDMMHRDPRIGVGMISWEAYDRNARTSTIAIADLATDERSNIDIAQALPRLSMSGNRLVYRIKQDSQWEIHLYDISAGSDRVIAALDRLEGTPYIEADKIAWCEHVKKEEFKGIPGQPLMDEGDIRDVFVYDIDSGRKRLIAKYLLSPGGRVSIHDGRVFLNVYREYPPPGRSNLVVPVDLWVW